MPPSSTSSLMPILIIVVIAIVIYSMYKKKKDKQSSRSFLSTRKNKDEVWKTIKQFLKDNGMHGQEIIDSYVLKRNHIDMIDPNGTYQYKKNKNFELKIRKWQRNIINKQNKNGMQLKPPKSRDLFVVVFSTKDNKNGLKNKTMCFECEVINTKIAKNEYDRKIVINGELNYDKEMEWIAPIHANEVAKNEIMKKRIEKEKEKQAKKEKKRLTKKIKKDKKHAAKK